MNKENIMKKRHIDLARNPKTAFTCTYYYDDIIRQKETDLVRKFISLFAGSLKVLDLGCGNGYTVDMLSKEFYEHDYYGIDLVEEMISNARKRELKECIFDVGDARKLNFNDSFFNLIYSQRCLINIPNWEGQKKALEEIRRVIQKNGYYLMIECFTDGLKNNNKARKECGLKELKPAPYNTYIDKDLFFDFIKDKFIVVRENDFVSNFFSSHFFIARVLHALVTKGHQIKNTEFVKFFSCLPPIGNYSPLQVYCLKKL